MLANVRCNNLMRKSLFLLLFLMTNWVAQAQSVGWMSLFKAQKLAAQNNKKVMLFAEADWCTYCHKMHKEVFPRKAVQDSLSKYFYPVRIDVESDSKVVFNGQRVSKKKLSRKLRLRRMPTTLFLNADGDVIGAQPGYLPADVFDKLLGFVGSDMTGKQSFTEYLKARGIDISQ